MKKIPETDAIFTNVHRENKKSDENPKSLRLSIDVKAKVKVGNLSRGGKSRAKEGNKADDHDTEWIESMVPMGIQDVLNAELSLYFGTSKETTDFIMDCLEIFWETNKEKYSSIEEIVINLDNGPSQESHRTQFIKRMVEFSQKINLPIRLIYYPPYHSKYNSVEHCFGCLENHWRGEILDSREAVLGFAKDMTWSGNHPLVELVDKPYETGIKLTKKKLRPFLKHFHRSSHLPKWDIFICP